MNQSTAKASGIIASIYILIGILVGVGVNRLHYYVDDYPYALDTPSLVYNFSHFVASYTSTHGIYRPVALLYYWLIYGLSFVSMSMAHLIPWILYCLAAAILYWILVKQGMAKSWALIASLLCFVHPFATEQYMWLSANPGTLATLAFFIQIALILQKKNAKKTLFLVCTISLVTTFLYESTFLLIFPLLYLYGSIRDIRIKSKRSLKLFALGIVPMGLYVLTKLFVHGSDPRPLADNLSVVLANTQAMVTTFFTVYLDNYYLTRFWHAYALDGWTSITHSPLVVLMPLLALLLGAVVYVLSKQEEVKLSKRAFIFWTMTFLLTLPPLVANKVFYFGFRSLALPSSVLIILIAWIGPTYLPSLSKWLLKILGVVLVGIFLCIDIAIADTYKALSNADMKLATEITNAVDNKHLTNATVILKSDIPFDSENSFLHADHMLSCFYYDWSSLSCTKTVSDHIARLATIHSNGRITTQAGEPFKTVLTYRPQITLHLNKNHQLSVEHVLTN
jgi:hypothetical protein